MTDQLLETLPSWKALTETERQKVRATASVRDFTPGEILYGRNVSCIGMIHVLAGEVRAYLLSKEGREITLFRVEEGDNCILSASCVLAHISFESTMVATKPSRILVIPASVFEALSEQNIHVRCFSYELATRRFSTVVFVMQMILFSGLDTRLASFLLQEYNAISGEEIRITQEQIAQNINSAREAVTRMLKRFAEDGIIENRRGVIRILDPDRLKALSADQRHFLQEKCDQVTEIKKML